MKIKFYFHKKRAKDKRGYVYCQYNSAGKVRKMSVGLKPIPYSAWNQGSERVKSYDGIDADNYNKEIDDFRDWIIKTNPQPISSDSKNSFLQFFRQHLDGPTRKTKHGTRLKYNGVYRKLESFLTSEGKSNLTFHDMDVQWIHSFYNYMTENGLHTNTATHYLKIIRIIIGVAQKTKGYYHVQDPFVNYSFEAKRKIKRVALDAGMIKALRNAKLESTKLEKTRAKFLFQLFANGMRPSDLALLRFKNLKGGRVTYQMYKTKNEVSFPINSNHVQQLEYFIEFKSNLQSSLLKLNPELEELYNNLEESGLGEPVCRSHFKGNYIPLYGALKYSTLVDELAVLLRAMEQEAYFNDLEDYDLLHEHMFMVKDVLSKLLKQHLGKVINELNIIAQKYPDDFVFDLLDKKEFPVESLLSESQYNQVKKKYIVYNRHLTELSKKADLPINLSPKLARASFASVLVNLPNVNTQLISGSLGHSSLQITQNYIAGFNSRRQDELTDNFGDMFWE